MRNAANTVDTVNAAAAAIVGAESRAQPTASSPKRRWGGCWSLYWCFGSHKGRKRISHAVLVPEPVVPNGIEPTAPNMVHSTSGVLPIMAPPSSPASFLQSDPPSATQSPCGLLSLSSLSFNAQSPGGPRSIFAIGPYAYETQLVSPPVFSAFTTEPSTASRTPCPESVQHTTPSSPEVPLAQLLTSALSHPRKNSGSNQKLTFSYYDFQSNQLYPCSPGGNIISPGSAISNSGTSSPFPDRNLISEPYKGEAPKVLGHEPFSSGIYGSRLGYGCLTPDGAGQSSRLGSGTLTPDVMGQGSRLGSGTLTPDGAGRSSRLGSGSLTPDCVDHSSRLRSGSLTPDFVRQGSRLGTGSVAPNDVGPVCRDSVFLANQFPEAATHPKGENGSINDETILDYRVSFELTGEDVARCLENKSVLIIRSELECPQDKRVESPLREVISVNNGNCEFCMAKSTTETSDKTMGKNEEYCYQKHRSVSFDSIKEFNFDNMKGDALVKPTISAEWWANEKVIGKEVRPNNNWSFFPMLQPGVS